MVRLAALLHRRRRRVLGAAVALCAIAAVLGVPVAGELHGAGLSDPDSESSRANAELDRATGGRDELGLAALVPRARLRAAQRTIAADPGVTLTRSWLDGHDPSFLSGDRRQALIAGAFAPHAKELDVAHRLRARLGPQGVLIGGSGLAEPEIADQVSRDLGRAELLAFPLLFVLALWVFRGLVAALMPPLVGALSIVFTFLLLRIVNAHVTSLSVYALNLVTGVCLGLAIDYSLFILSRYREEAAAAGYGREALERTLATAGRTVLFSALTVAAAMAALLVFPLRFLYSMGIGGLLGSLTAATVALTILPALLAVLGPRVNALSPSGWRRAADATARPAASGPWYRLAQWVMRRAPAVALVTATLLVVFGLPFLRANFISADWHIAPPGSELRTVAETVERDFPTAATDPIRVVATTRPGDNVAGYARTL